MKGIPQKIYLQVGEDIEGIEQFKELEVSWASYRIYPTDIEYVLPTPASKSAEAVKLSVKECLYASINNLSK